MSSGICKVFPFAVDVRRQAADTSHFRQIPTFDFRGAAAFPLNELAITAVLIVLIALGLYFFAGAWGVLLLWCLALLFVAPQGFATLALVEGSAAERAKGRRGVAAAYLACAGLWFSLWLAGTGYCAYRAYRAWGAIP